MATTKTLSYIFIVENEKRYVKMLDYIFTKDLNHFFVNYATGEECVANMTLNPDMIVLDYNLSGMNGYQTLLEIRKSHPHTYVLVLLSDKDEKLPSDLFEAGANDYILKEANNGAELTEKIEGFLSRNKLEKRVHQGSISRPSVRNMTYLILILLLVSAGLYYSN
jgi:two-component system OmpR family response regulator